MTFTRTSKLFTNKDESKYKSDKAQIKSQPTLTPNKGQKPFPRPLLTRSIPEFSAMIDSLSPMTLNETDQMPRNEYEFDNMGKTTDKTNAYME